MWQLARGQTCPDCPTVGWTPGAGRTVPEAIVLHGSARVDLNHLFSYGISDDRRIAQNLQNLHCIKLFNVYQMYCIGAKLTS